MPLRQCFTLKQSWVNEWDNLHDILGRLPGHKYERGEKYEAPAIRKVIA